ncbi:hypothetical protein ACFYT3_09810 [Nocardia amikacinitolerans]|uniref:hypothetical protein n=1 Tax=Nocardia amikacinitolerans TaxID=756689 RepID=UPI0036B798BB
MGSTKTEGITAMWFGYARWELLSDQEHASMYRAAMHEYAEHYGFDGPGEVILEPTAPELLLQQMLLEVDQRDPGVAVMGRLQQVAQSRGVDLERVFDAGSPRTQRLWQIVDAFEGSAGGHLIVPSRAHLTELGPSGRAVLARLTRMARAHLYFLEPADRDLFQPLFETSAAAPLPRVGGQVLVESRVGAIPTVTRLEVVEELARRGWPELMEPVDAVYLALIEDASAAARAAGVLGFGPGGQQGVIRLLLRDDGRLVVELEESRYRVDEPNMRLSARCAQADRSIEHGRTITRCTLPSMATPSGERGGW